jgi:hypothetical protein
MPYREATVTILGFLAALGTVGTLVFALLSTTVTVPNTGTVSVPTAGLGVYWDIGFSQEVTVIDWGVLSPGQSKQVTVYIRNEGNVDLVLNMTTSNWSPSSAASYITLDWNREGYPLSSGATVQAVFTLSVSSDISGVENFSLDITISGTESV